MSEKFFISDTHFFHNNVIQYCKRPFSCAEEMNEHMIKNWNERVRKQDIVYHLGDFSFGSVEEDLKLLDRLKGQKFLMIGNHDHSKKLKKIGHKFQNVRYADTIKVEAEGKTYNIFLSHYPHLRWPGIGRGVYHLFGHVHGEDIGALNNSFDVGVDSEMMQFKPLLFEEILWKSQLIF